MDGRTMRTLTKVSMIVGLLVCGSADAALGVSFGLYSSADCSSCNIEIPDGEMRTIRVAVAETHNLDRVGGGEFRLAGSETAR